VTHLCIFLSRVANQNVKRYNGRPDGANIVAADCPASNRATLNRCTHGGGLNGGVVNLWHTARFTRKSPWNGALMPVVNLVNLVNLSDANSGRRVTRLYHPLMQPMRRRQVDYFPAVSTYKVHKVHKVHKHRIYLWIGRFRVNLFREPWLKGSRAS
jgi:hypothetical protein